MSCLAKERCSPSVAHVEINNSDLKRRKYFLAFYTSRKGIYIYMESLRAKVKFSSVLSYKFKISTGPSSLLAQ
jgi:hypothetical protein